MQTRKYRFRNIPMRRKAKRMPRLVRVDCFECVLDEYFWKRWDYEIFGWYFFLTSAIIFAHNLRDAVFGPYLFGPH